jgi:hypothetical protein
MTFKWTKKKLTLHFLVGSHLVYIPLKRTTTCENGDCEMLSDCFDEEI